MSCSLCGCETQFNHKVAAKDLRSYRKRGPIRTSRMLVDALRVAGVKDFTLLDIGGGVGAVQHGLLQAGILRVTAVDASSAYLKAAQEEAERRGYTDRIKWHRGDFVTAAINAADVVTLDRVICCYRDMQALVGQSAAHAHRLYGVVYPRSTWWTRGLFRMLNVLLGLRRSTFRAFVHSPADVDRLIRDAGFVLLSHTTTLIWQVCVYVRSTPG